MPNTVDRFIMVRGARQHNLRNFDVDIPRNAFVVFTGVSGSGKSSLAFGTIFAEAQRRYFESIAPYARRLMAQMPAPKVTDILGLPPAVALQQRRGEPSSRSSVGTLTKISNSLRMLFSRAGTYPPAAGQKKRLDSDAFSPNTTSGACPSCHGIGITHTVTEESLVPDPNLSIKERAIASWPGAWQGKNYRDILATLGYDIDKPWHKLSKKDRQWILFTEEKPVVTVYAEREAHRIQRPYRGTYMSAASYVKHTFSTTQSATLRKRAESFMQKSLCESCLGKRLQPAALAVTFGGFDITDLGHMPMAQLAEILINAQERKSEVAALIVDDLLERISLLKDLGLAYLSLDRITPSLSAGELQRLRLATQLKSGLFGVVYVLDEPSAGLHPADSEALILMLQKLKEAGNTLFVVEHEMAIVKKADWIVDIGPHAGEAGGNLLYSGPVEGLKKIECSLTKDFLFAINQSKTPTAKKKADFVAWLSLKNVNRHNLKDLAVQIPLAALTVVTGISGSGKSTLVTQVLAEAARLTLEARSDKNSHDGNDLDKNGLDENGLDNNNESDLGGEFLGEESFPVSESEKNTVVLEGMGPIKRFVSVDQKPIGRTPRSNLATYTGFFDHVRKIFAATPIAKKLGFNAGRFSFNVSGGRCNTCEGEGFISVELMFLPSVYTPCTTCLGTRYNTETLAVTYRDKNIAQILEMTVDSAAQFFADISPVARALSALTQVGLGYLRLGQPATELSGGEAQRIRLATELQREQQGDTLYMLDEPTTGLHPADVQKLMRQINSLVDAGNTVIIVEHDMDVVAAADWVIDLGPGAGIEGGKVVVAGTPQTVAKAKNSRTGPYLLKKLNG